MHYQTTLEGAECLRRSDAGWQSVPGTLFTVYFYTCTCGGIR